MQSLFAYDEVPTKPDINNQATYILTDAIIAYEEKNYSQAFELVQKAKDSRKNESEWALAVLKKALLVPSTQKIGTDIESILDFFIDRKDVDVVNVLQYVLQDFSSEYFDYNIENLVSLLKLTINFPEADYLLGKLYLLEGELDIAEKFLLQSYDYKNLLNIPEVQFDILYTLADLYQLKGDNNSYEQVLLLIIAGNKDSHELPGLLHATTNAIKNNMSTDNFFLFFRDNYYIALDAWFRLAHFYRDHNQLDKSFESAILLNLVSFTRIDEVLKDRDMHYSFTTITDFFARVKSFYDIHTWAIENNVWEGFYLLASIAREKGYVSFATDIFVALATECSQREWRILSEKEL